jgi:hypothetical protein
MTHDVTHLHTRSSNNPPDGAQRPSRGRWCVVMGGQCILVPGPVHATQRALKRSGREMLIPNIIRLWSKQLTGLSYMGGRLPTDKSPMIPSADNAD